MKCICSGCFTILAIKIDKLREMKHPVFKCLKCDSIIKLKPNTAKCGSCANEIKYHKYRFDPAHPFTKCKACGVTNKVNVTY